MPKVSVLVPVYNVEKYLRECLESLINQTLEDIEIICINDGSTDSSPDILDEYSKRDKRVKVINKKNTGYGHSMNTGLDAACGEYIGILESDDFTDKNMYEDLYRLAKENDADIVKSDWYNYWSTNAESRKDGKISAADVEGVVCARTDKNLLRGPSYIWSSIYKRDFLNSKKIRFLETPGASFQDTSFFLKATMAAERIKLSSNAYIHYRRDNESSSVKSKGKVYCICDEYNEVERYINENPYLKEPFLEYIYALKYRAYFWNMLRVDKQFAKEFIERFSEEFKSIENSEYIGKYFYKRVKKEEISALINDKEKFYKIYEKRAKKAAKRELRKKFISININSSRVSIVLFGRQIFATK